MKTNNNPLIYGIVANSKTRVRCVFCGVYIPKANKCIDQHVNGIKHKENMEIMSENGINFNGDTLHCKICNCSLAEESVTKHIEEDEHATWMASIEELADAEFINLEPFLSSKKEEGFCEACNCNVECSFQSIQEHVNGSNHKFNACEKLKPFNGIFPTENTDEVWCKLCNLYVDNTVQSIFDHIDSDYLHKEWFYTIDNLIEDHHIVIENYLSLEHEINVYCKKCNMEIICNTQSIEDHVNSEAHLNNLINASI